MLTGKDISQLALAQKPSSLTPVDSGEVSSRQAGDAWRLMTFVESRRDARQLSPASSVIRSAPPRSPTSSELDPAQEWVSV